MGVGGLRHAAKMEAALACFNRATHIARLRGRFGLPWAGPDPHR
jgi:hypothetical protein